MGEWISVKDKLPNKEGKYLCCWKGFIDGQKFIDIFSFAKNLKKVNECDFANAKRAGWYEYDSEWGYCEMCGVTHWMPLPELPKE